MDDATEEYSNNHVDFVVGGAILLLALLLILYFVFGIHLYLVLSVPLVAGCFLFFWLVLVIRKKRNITKKRDSDMEKYKR